MKCADDDRYRILERFKNAAGEQRAGYLVVLAALGAALSLVERIIPVPVPGVKPGLANVITLLLLYGGFSRDAFTVVLLRTTAAAVAAGSLFTPGHLLSLSGGVCAAAVMWLLINGLRGWLSVYGVSAAGAWAHTAVQLLIAGVLLIPWSVVRPLAVPLLLLATGAGVLTGWVAARFLRILYPDRMEGAHS